MFRFLSRTWHWIALFVLVGPVLRQKLAAADVLPGDVHRLEAVLRQAVPSAEIRVIPTDNAVVLIGLVERIEDMRRTLDAAQSVGGLKIINALRIGGPRRVQFDVVIAQVRGGLARTFASHLLKDSTQVKGRSFVGIIDCPHDTCVVRAFLKTLHDEDLGNLIADQRLVNNSEKQASFLSGSQPIPVSEDPGPVEVQFDEFGIRLKCASVVLDGKFRMEIETEVSGPIGAKRPKQCLRTTTELKVGQSVLIDGLVQTGTKARANIPANSNDPSVERKARDETFETVILVTPSLVEWGR